MIGKTLGHYEITSQLGKGGMGEVFQAKDRVLGRDVAIKILPEEFAKDADRVSRFQREAKLLASLNHPNIAAIHGLEDSGGTNFLVLELVEGETLAQRLRKGPLLLEEALGICRQIAEGLEAAHEKGVTHRDLKPANVMITEGDKVKILDFGLAKALSEETVSVDSSQSPTVTEAMTRPGVILGTAAYMSPEQTKGKSVDKRADIWAFGCILYECLTGKKAFEGETVPETLAAILRADPDWNVLSTDIPQNIRFVLRRCLEKDKSRRFRNAADVQIEIEEARDISEAETPMAGRRPWLAWSVAAVAVLFSIAVTFLHFRNKPSPQKDLMRFDISLPDNLRLDYNGGFELSPDARHVAFAAADSDGIKRLWLRSLDSLVAKPILGTEFEGLPSFFWSYDSRFIAYAAGGKLNRIDILRGSPQPICDTPRYPVGGSWNRDGIVIFGTDGGSLMRVPAAGGSAQPLTVLKPDRQETGHHGPVFLPDGKHFLYYRVSGNPENRGAYIGSLDAAPGDQSTTLLLPTGFMPRYVHNQDSDTGYLLYLDKQNLMVRRFDDRHLTLLGEPKHLTDQIGFYANGGFFSASDKNILVYMRGGGSRYSQPTLFDRVGNVTGRVGEAGVYYRLAISPHNNRAAVSWINPATSSSDPDVWLLDMVHGTRQRLTHGQGSSSRPIWDPDGNQIIFNSNREGAFNLYLKSVKDDGEAKLLWKSNASSFPTSWSCNGRFVLFTKQSPETRQDLWVLPMQDKNKAFPFHPTEFNEGDGHFSPNTKWIAYQSDETGRYEIYVREFTGAAGDALSAPTQKRMISRDGGMGPRWSRDGKALFYRAGDAVMAVQIKDGVEFEHGTPRRLFQAPSDDSTLAGIAPFPTWDVSPDGSQFILAVPKVDSSSSPFTVILNWTSLLEQ